MVIERADIMVTAGRESEFEAAMQRGCALLLAAGGCTAVALARCIERPQRYELKIHWETQDRHTEFTRTEEFKTFRELVGPFFAERPSMEHYRHIHEIRRV
jgi:heme-degrading monooxygenase HmoA